MGQMRAVYLREFGGPDVLRVETVERPEPRADEILIEVHATSVNPVDFKTRSGAYPAVTEQQLPRILGRDVAGLVVRCGAEVQQFRVGDPVYALVDQEHGGYAEYVALRAELCTLKPQTLDYSAAAAVPLASLTAWQGLFDHGELRAGETVLIHGGAGGVGHFAIQFAKAKGARVLTTASGGDLELVRRLGADVAIDYKTQRFEAEVRDVDLVFDLVAGDTQRRSWSVLKPGGRLVSTLGQPPDDEAKQPRARGIGYMVRPNAAQLTEIAALIDRGIVKPVVEARFTLEQVRSAQHRVEREHSVGKVVIDVIEPVAA